MTKNNGLRQTCDRMILPELANPEVLPSLLRSLRLWSHISVPLCGSSYYQDSKKDAYDTKGPLKTTARSRLFEAGKTRLTNAGCSV